MGDWKSFEIAIPGKDVLEPVRNILETLLVFLEILKTILETIKAFLIDFGNPIKALVEALLKILMELVESLKATGVFAYYDIPDPLKDPNFALVSGGYPAFIERFKGSLYDTKDFNRPQPRSSTTSGFVILAVDSDGVSELIALIRALLRFFGKEFASPRYEAPANFKAIPVGASGDPIFAVASVFTDGPIEAIQLQWTLPSTVATPDPGFSDVVSSTLAEFIPPSFIIEKSVGINPASVKIDIGELGNADAVGLVQVDVPVNVDYKLASRFAKTDGTTVLATQSLLDDQQEPVVKFQKYIKVGVATQLMGQLGTFRYVDTDVTAGTVYYYRIRAYSGDLNVSGTGEGNLVGLPTSYKELKPPAGGNVRTRYLQWPGTDVVMGKPTGIVRTTVPQDLGDFDVIENLRNLFLTAFSLDFQMPLPAETPEGTPPQFDSQGLAVEPTPANFIGRGALTNQAGVLAAFESQFVLEYLAGLDTPSQAFDTESLQGLSMPWQRLNVQRMSYRLADGAAQAMIALGGGEAMTFRDFMRGPLPRGAISTGGNLAGKTKLEDIVKAFTTPSDEVDNDEVVITTYQSAYFDAALRANVLVVIQFLKNFTLGGVPPDWISISPLRDIIPWAGQMLYDILDKIQALLDAFQGFLEEIRKFIELLERKIDALEKFIEFLLDILNFIMSLELGVYLLSVQGLSGDVSSWISAVDSAGGDIPPSGPGGYTAGISLAYVAVDVGAFVTAFSVIFGG